MTTNPAPSDAIFEQAFAESLAEFNRIEAIEQAQVKAAEKAVLGFIMTAAQVAILLAAALIGIFMAAGQVKYVLLAVCAGILLSTGPMGLKNLIRGVRDGRALGVARGEEPPVIVNEPQFTGAQALTIGMFVNAKVGHPGLGRWMTDFYQRIAKLQAEQNGPAA